MNQTAKELGCTDSNFVNTNGKHDDNHYTSTHDLALIGQKFFSDDVLCRMSDTVSYKIPASATLSQDLIPNSKNKLLPGKTYAYEYLVGSKTGYTANARSNLVSCAQKDGLKLICVVMMEESPQQFKDTISLFDYGFSNFSSVTASKEDTTYQVKNGDLFANTFNQSNILSIDPDAKVLLPDTLTFADLDSELSYDNLKNGQAAVIHYSYEGQDLGSAPILFSSITPFDFSAEPVSETESAAIATADGSSRQMRTAYKAALLMRKAAQTAPARMAMRMLPVQTVPPAHRAPRARRLAPQRLNPSLPQLLRPQFPHRGKCYFLKRP